MVAIAAHVDMAVAVFVRPADSGSFVWIEPAVLVVAVTAITAIAIVAVVI